MGLGVRTVAETDEMLGVVNADTFQRLKGLLLLWRVDFQDKQQHRDGTVTLRVNMPLLCKFAWESRFFLLNKQTVYYPVEEIGPLYEQFKKDTNSHTTRRPNTGYGWWIVYVNLYAKYELYKPVENGATVAELVAANHRVSEEGELQEDVPS